MSTASLFYAALNLVPHMRREEARDVAEAIYDAAVAEDVDASLLLALAYRESTLNVKEINPKTRCRGLMQIAPVHSADLPGPMVFSARWSARMGAKLLRGAYEHTHDWVKAVCRFNGRHYPKSCTWGKGVMHLAEHLRTLQAESWSPRL